MKKENLMDKLPNRINKKVLVQAYISKELYSKVRAKMLKSGKKVCITALIKASFEQFLEE